MTKFSKSSAPPNLGRHEAGCKICSHPDRKEIERDFIRWKSPATITTEYRLRHRASVYRHAHAFDLFSKRARNLRGALEYIIEKAADVPVNASAVVGAVLAYARINAQGHPVEKKETVTLGDLFDRMNLAELETYAKTGVLPAWFQAAGATSRDGSGEANNE